jgi:hypothetical protein
VSGRGVAGYFDVVAGELPDARRLNLPGAAAPSEALRDHVATRSPADGRLLAG